ncbi:ribosomal protein L6 [Cylindrobasidium torrendii FP15055 ss-10]|uniref:Ribosomal protein L6 n=1 Tax=Cylindrobasidium torrendii FP15055 ss-10 TaxID=1314674 RepID=A0A0D7AY34_9AGAR|nr:ribosomal protein L6 [Cylindrobasidium torrendii FP15055 ss-10]
MSSLHRLCASSRLATRSFCSSAPSRSRIGSSPIEIPPNVTLDRTPTGLNITGPKGTAVVPLHPFVELSNPTPSTLAVAIQSHAERMQRAMWGTTRTHIANAIVGITDGFELPIYLVGVGYRAALEQDPRGTQDGGSGQRFSMKLGYSHTVYIPIPPHIDASVASPTKLILKCTDKHQIGLFAARIREHRKPEPYKGKGIFVGDETVRIKAAKKK